MRHPTYAKALSAYATANSTVPPLVAVVRLYEKALVHLHRAREAAAAGRYDDHFHAVERATMILAGLDSILDMKKGGEVAQVLRRFYRTTVMQAGLAAARTDPVAATDSVIRQVSGMTRTWQSIAAERGVVSDTSGALAKGPHAARMGRPNHHDHGGNEPGRLDHGGGAHAALRV